MSLVHIPESSPLLEKELHLDSSPASGDGHTATCPRVLRSLQAGVHTLEPQENTLGASKQHGHRGRSPRTPRHGQVAVAAAKTANPCTQPSPNRPLSCWPHSLRPRSALPRAPWADAPEERDFPSRHTCWHRLLVGAGGPT